MIFIIILFILYLATRDGDLVSGALVALAVFVLLSVGIKEIIVFVIYGSAVALPVILLMAIIKHKKP